MLLLQLNSKVPFLKNERHTDAVCLRPSDVESVFVAFYLLKTHGNTMGMKMAVAFDYSFIGRVEYLDTAVGFH